MAPRHWTDEQIWEAVWERIDWDEDEPDRCWEWQRLKNPKGYGLLSWTRPGQSRIAHRFVYEQMVGPVPPGKVVRHTCDNPPCCNPSHLVLGTKGDNQQDMVERGRSKARHWGQGGFCVNGHPWDTNERIVGRHRICRACKTNDQRQRRQRTP